jgi:hypothetical protein
MRGGVLPGFLQARLPGLARLLVAPGLEIVGHDLVAVLPAENAERSGEQTA